ncbi:MAG: NAD(P)/FAD-dependent oxidoreductase [Armatimonadota bacterium]|nr:NAD(P)/FAD-dependent oxidoreductase [bacterium]
MASSRVVIIGGGAAGMVAAGRAAESGANAVLLEKGSKLGRKLRIAGKGRGNVTNTAELRDFIEAFEPNGKFLYGAFSRYFRDDLLDFLRKMGVETKVERGGRVFPVSDRAGDVANAFERWMESVGVRIKYNATAKSIEVKDGRVVGVKLYGGRTDADAVVLATGGASYPKTGSTGDGYHMARELGHTIVRPRPALSALVVSQNWVRQLQGLSLRNVEVTLLRESPGQEIPTRIASEFGEMLFTQNGVSGPIILTLSRKAGVLLDHGKTIISIDLKPALTREQLHERFIRDFKQTRHFKNYLHDLLPRLMVEVFVRLVAIDPDKPVNTITASERTDLVDLLKDFRVTVKRMAPLDEAIVTAGGVSIKEIDPKTMMSKLVDGLFFAGEVIDIDAETGGYNLQAAFSTGYVAGEAAAEFAQR